MFVKEIPEAEKEFPSVMLEDQDLKDELKNKKQIDLEVILDFTYLPVMVEGEEEENVQRILCYLWHMIIPMAE